MADTLDRDLFRRIQDRVAIVGIGHLPFAKDIGRPISDTAVEAIQLFDLVYTTTRGGPLNATTTIVYFLYDKAFHSLQFGYGSAAAYVLFAVTMIITIGVVMYSRRRGTDAF